METQSSIGWMRRIVLLMMAALMALTIAVMPAQAHNTTARNAAEECEDADRERRCCDRHTRTEAREDRCVDILRDDD